MSSEAVSSEAAPSEADDPERELRPSDVVSSRDVGERLSTVVAFLTLLIVDLVMKVAGFQRFHRLIGRFPVRQGIGAGPDAATRIAASVDRASIFYFKRAWCLQRSAATVCLMRWRGLPADLVIGIHRLPFYAHAWVEIEGAVVNDHPVVQRRYSVLERCSANATMQPETTTQPESTEGVPCQQ